ncbi:MAG TPA: hypothetical protein VJ083_05390, partial [Sedimentibacter sp.]|nr:hypothetical protein [Sedimentibacter sp.]
MKIMGYNIMKKYIFVLLTFILLFVLAACTNKQNSANNESLSGKDDDLLNTENGNKTIYLAGGCFWGTDKYLSMVNGVVG